MNLQNLVYTMSSGWRKDRSRYHLTLGGLIEALEKARNPEAVVVFSDTGKSPTRPHSYRGYYDDLAFQDGEPVAAKDLLNRCLGALNNTFEGYKGGDFLMGSDAPLWASAWGSSSDRAIVCARDEGDKIVLGIYEAKRDKATKDDSDTAAERLIRYSYAVEAFEHLEADIAAFTSQHDEDGMTPWDGGGCPVGRETKVFLRLRGGEEITRFAGEVSWGRFNPVYPRLHQLDIVAYKIIEPKP